MPNALNSSCTVSVCMITYNHERFIAQAIESVLMQKTDFVFELLVGEDCSTDRTREIVLEYQAKYPAIVRPLLWERNVGMLANFERTFQACRGEYIALVEGDDFWTSPFKLQRQVEFMREHPNCSLCFHKIVEFWDDGRREAKVLPSDMRPSFDLADLLGETFIPTCSVMVRRGVVSEFPEWMCGLRMVIDPFCVLHAEFGRVAQIPETMAAYRKHSGGICSGADPIGKMEGSIAVRLALAEYLEEKHRSQMQAIRQYLGGIHKALAHAYFKNGELWKARRHALWTVWLSQLPGERFDTWKLLVLVCFPRATWGYRWVKRVVFE